VSKGGKQLDFEQFYEIVQAVDDLAEGGAEEDDEEVSIYILHMFLYL
jgi:hypothetical protein